MSEMQGDAGLTGDKAGSGPAGAARSQRTQAPWEQILGPFDRRTGTLHAQLVRTFIAAIDAKKLPSGMRVPSGRDLSRMLGIGRNTAMLALSDLVQRGYMVSRQRSGVYVADRVHAPAAEPRTDAPAGAPDWATRFVFDSATDAQSAMSVPPGDAKVNFLYGQFDAGLFPAGHWRECERAALSVLEIAHWGRDMVDGDDVELIDCLRKYILPDCGIWANPDEIIVTLGGQQGRYLVGQLLCRPGVKAGIENPGMPDMAKILRLTGAEIRPLDIDAHGLVPTAAVDQCDVVFVTSGHQCPTTAVMPRERRLELLERARRHDFILVEDTFETDLIREERLPSLKGMDADQRVVHVGSLSKLLAPGLRVGFVVAPAVVIKQLRALRRLIHRHPPGNNQRALAMFIERGYHRAHLRRASREFRQRSAVLAAALGRWLPDFRWRHQEGAASFWIEVPPDLDVHRLAAAAAHRGVLIEPGDRFFRSGDRPQNFIRLAVSSVTECDIEKGIRLLAEARRALHRPG